MIGRTLAHHRVTAAIGSGGMGEVYRATDTTLGREVAIKVLPAEVAHDPERLGRFEREARLLASLNHPNIAAIYGLDRATSGEAGDKTTISFITMELVEGEDLAARLARGPMPPDEALPIARQIAEALEAAHEKGIIHRDLKPANVKVTPEGKVKVLDFGLAKAWAGDGSVTGGDASQSPTLINTATSPGLILGTAAYMSPEQARGKPLDKRADIWAFGVVLFEMLTGRMLFAGETVSDVLAAVLTRDPDWSRLPSATPPGVVRLLRRCLAREPRERLRDIGDAWPDLADATVSAPEPARSSRAWLPWAVATLAVAALAAVLAQAVWTRAPQDRPAPVDGHFTIELPSDAPIVTLEIPGTSQGPLDVSPDGRQVVYVAPNGSGTRLYVRAMTDLIPRALAGTEGARFPFFSPDGKWVGFFADGKLKKTLLSGGTPVTLADAPVGQGGSWGLGGDILFGASSTLSLVPETGGTPRRVTTLDYGAGDDSHLWPQLLPDGRTALMTVASFSLETAYVVRVDLSSGSRRTVLDDAEFARYVPAAPGANSGHVLFVRRGALMAAPFDPSGLAAAGQPVAVIEGVRSGQFSVSDNAVLAYTPGTSAAPAYTLVWVDRSGTERAITDLVRGYEDLDLSPDGRRVALTLEEAGPGSAAQVWLADTERGTLTRVTFDGLNRDPVWLPDGRSFVFGSKREGPTFGLYRQALDGRSPDELVWTSPIPSWPNPESVTPDGRTLFFSTQSRDTGDDIWVIPLDGERRARPWLQTPAAEWAARVSPDGRWVAYNSNQSGSVEVYVQPFPGPGTKHLVSQSGGFSAIWSRDGRRLFYRHDDQIVAVDVETEGGFTTSSPTVLFAGRYRDSGRDYDVSPDGLRFVMMRNVDPRTTTSVRVLLNWWRALESRAGGDAR